MDADTLRSKIEAGIPGAQVEAQDTHGTGDHFEVTVVAEHFEGKNLVARHRLVYEALGDAMKSEIHALMIRTLTPEQYQGGLMKID